MKKIKKVLVSLTAATVSAASLCIVPSASAGVSGKYSTYSYYFKAEPNTYIGFCEANASYNTGNVEFYRNSNGELGGKFSVSNTGSGTMRKITVDYRNSSPTKDSGYLGYVTFKTTSTPPNFTVTSLVNDRGNNLTIDDKNIKIIPILMGDANQDGRVEIADATLILQSLTGNSAYQLNENGKLAADVNFDGVVTEDDALLIQQLDARVINGF